MATSQASDEEVEDEFSPALRFQRAQAARSLRALARDNLLTERKLKQAGIEVPEEETGKTGLNWLGDMFTTGGQMVRGGIAKLLDVPGYEDSSFLDSVWNKGPEDDITTGEIIRRKKIPWLSDEGWGPAIARGAIGLVGDTLTDPVSYISPFSTIGPRIGGAAVDASATFNTAEGVAKTSSQLYDDLLSTSYKALQTPLDEQLAKGLIDPTKYQLEKVGNLSKAASEAEAPFRLIRSVAERQWKNAKGGGEALKVLEGELGSDPYELTTLVNKALKPLGIDPTDFNASDMFAKPAFHFVNPIPGTGSGYGNIPGLTKFSSEIYDDLGGRLYNASLKVGKFLDKGVALGEKEGLGNQVISLAARGVKGAAAVPKLVSRSLATGNSMALENLKDHEISRGYLRSNINARADALFSGMDKESLALMDKLLESGLRQRFDINKTWKLTADGWEQRAFDEALSNMVNVLEGKKPGLGEEARRLVLKVQDDFAKWGADAVADGTIARQLEGYTHKSYDITGRGIVPDKALKGIREKLSSDFTLPRVYGTFAEAQANGLKPIFSIKNAWAERLYQKEILASEHRLMERMAYEVGIPAATREKLAKLLASPDEQVASAAASELKRLGIEAPKEVVAAAIDKATGLRRFSGGDPLTREAYETLENMLRGKNIPEAEAEIINAAYNPAQIAKRAGAAVPEIHHQTIIEADKLLSKGAYSVEDAIAAAEARRMGLTFQPGEVDDVAQAFENYKGHFDRTLGRAGEMITDRAGGASTPDRFQKLIKNALRSQDMTQEDLDYFTGTLPRSVVEAVNDSLDTRSTMDRMLENLPDKNPMKKSLTGMRDAYLGWVGALKSGATYIFPAFHARNATSAQFQGAAEASFIGRQINPLALMETHNINVGDETVKLVQKGTGRVFTAPELREAFTARGGKVNYNSAADLMDSVSTSLGASFMKRLPKSIQKGAKKYESLAGAIESYGREHLFYGLVKEGHSLDSAAALTNKIMVDYAHGKTRFEKDFLNNIIFFYSFARHQTANTLTSLVTKPGAITAQINAVDAAKEVLMDPNAVDLPPDVEARMQSLRNSETLSRYLGEGRSGLPQMLSQVGLPVEDVTRFFNFKAPREMSMKGVVDAGMESAQRTAQTIVSSFNPLIKFPLEVLAAKRNLFFDRPITDKSLRRMALSENEVTKLMTYNYKLVPKEVFQTIDSGLKKALGGVDNGDGTMTVDPYVLSILTYLVPGASRTIATTNALAKEGNATSSKFLRTATGVKVNEVDPETTRAYDRKQQLQEIMNLAAVPKNKAQFQQFLRLKRQDEDE